MLARPAARLWTGASHRYRTSVSPPCGRLLAPTATRSLWPLLISTLVGNTPSRVRQQLGRSRSSSNHACRCTVRGGLGAVIRACFRPETSGALRNAPRNERERSVPHVPFSDEKFAPHQGRASADKGLPVLRFKQARSVFESGKTAAIALSSKLAQTLRNPVRPARHRAPRKDRRGPS